MWYEKITHQNQDTKLNLKNMTTVNPQKKKNSMVTAFSYILVSDFSYTYKVSTDITYEFKTPY